MAFLKQREALPVFYADGLRNIIFYSLLIIVDIIDPVISPSYIYCLKYCGFILTALILSLMERRMTENFLSPILTVI